MTPEKQDDTGSLRKEFADALRQEAAENGLTDVPVISDGTITWTFNQIADQIEHGTPEGLAFFEHLQEMKKGMNP